jgi:hypothetical protein
MNNFLFSAMPDVYWLVPQEYFLNETLGTVSNPNSRLWVPVNNPRWWLRFS